MSARTTTTTTLPLRYTLPLIYYALCVFSLLVCRSATLLTLARNQAQAWAPFYAALYTLPALALIHATLAGLLYYGWPFLLLIGALGSNALHLALYEIGKQSGGRLLVEICKNPVYISSVIGHCLLFSYGVVAVHYFPDIYPQTGMYGEDSSAKVWLAVGASLLMGPAPTLFYLLTARLTHPKMAEEYRLL